LQSSLRICRADEICTSIARIPVQTSGGAVPITMSLGLLLGQEWGFLPLEELLQQADAALYAAKAARRNCMKVAIPKITPVDPDSRAPEPVRQRR